MRERRFVMARRGRWDRLAVLVDRTAKKGGRALDAAEIDELALAYRAATSDLAIARTRGEDPVILDHLNRLTARAHSVVYVATARTGWAREVRRSWAPIGFCTALTVVSAIVAYASVWSDPTNVHALVPGIQIPPMDRSLHDSNFGFDRANSPLAATEIITNNVQVAAVAFAGGMTGGLLTGWILLTHGVVGGARGGRSGPRPSGARGRARRPPAPGRNAGAGRRAAALRRRHDRRLRLAAAP